MNSINSTPPDLQSQESQAVTPPKQNELGQDEFLKLMLAQLEHQDPFKPMENGEFVAQMAQFSTVAGIENMDKSLSGMSEAYAGSQLLQSSSLIGRTALMLGSTAILGEEAGIDALYKLDESTTSLNFDVYNQAGELVHHSENTAQSSGMHEIQWDGFLESGERAPAGPYTLSVTHGTAESQINADLLIQNKIKSVALIPGSNSVEFETEEGATVSLQDIEQLQ